MKRTRGANSRRPSLRALIPLSLLAIGLVLMVLQFLANAGTYWQALFVNVEHPASYHFLRLDQMLQRYVRNGLVDYGALKGSPELNAQISELSRISPDHMHEQSQQLAFWINSYNLLVLKAVADRYPLNSVRNISQSFSLRKFLIGGKTYSIQDVDFQLHAGMDIKDPRPLLLICPAAVGYPALLNHAIQAEHLQDDMTSATEAFVNDERNVYYDEETNTFLLSRFFKWNENAFARAYGSTHYFADLYLAPDKRIPLNKAHLKTDYMKNFDWSLNDISRAASTRG